MKEEKKRKKTHRGSLLTSFPFFFFPPWTSVPSVVVSFAFSGIPSPASSFRPAQRRRRFRHAQPNRHSPPPINSTKLPGSGTTPMLNISVPASAT